MPLDAASKAASAVGTPILAAGIQFEAGMSVSGPHQVLLSLLGEVSKLPAVQPRSLDQNALADVGSELGETSVEERGGRIILGPLDLQLREPYMIEAVPLTRPRCAEEVHVAAVEAPRDEAQDASAGAVQQGQFVKMRSTGRADAAVRRSTRAAWEDGYQTKVSDPSPAEVARRYGLDADLAAGLESISAWTGAVVNR